MDYYQRLEVISTATEAEIKKAYRRLAMKYHPDRNPGDKDAENTFKLVQEAYAILNDSLKKFDYDQRSGFYHEIKPSEEEFVHKSKQDSGFSASRRYRATKDELDAIQCQFFGGSGLQGKNILLHIIISKEELVIGTTRCVRWKKRDKCKSCEDYDALNLKCKVCKGTGLWDMVIEEMMIDIPAGTPGGHQIVVRGRGEHAKDGVAGNLHVVVIESS